MTAQAHAGALRQIIRVVDGGPDDTTDDWPAPGQVEQLIALHYEAIAGLLKVSA